MKSRYGLEIRAATVADAGGLSSLLSAAALSISARDLSERLEQMRSEQAAAIVAIEWGPPSGLVILHWYQGLDAALPKAQITNLIVAPDDRRRGIGRLLLKAAAQTARVAGCGSLELLVSEQNSILQAFCGATGFGKTGERFERPLRKRT